MPAPEKLRSNMTTATRFSPNVSKTPALPQTRKSPSARINDASSVLSPGIRERLIKCCRPEILEAALGEGLKLLTRLENVRAASTTSVSAVEQLKDIENLRQESVERPTIIAIMGSTGTGKSSLINAILDEDDIIPTSCMRACTAVVTEIRYNDDETPYRAEIQYLTRSAWEAELTVLLAELHDDDGKVSKECMDETCAAGAAYSKIRAVYPEMTLTKIESHDVKMMVDQVADQLNKDNNPRRLSATDPRIFRAESREFVESKDKGFGKSHSAMMGVAVADPERQLWPSIEVVRIYTKSPALSTGATLVDLPGLADANAGRAKIAQHYVQHATKIWIVAPMIRAVDDGIARSLLGDSMKRQLVSDLNLKSITFICSKTDEIDFDQLQKLPEVEAVLQPLLCEKEELRCANERLTKESKEYKRTKDIYKGKYDEANREHLKLMELTEDQGQVERPRKRRRKALRAEIETLEVEKASADSEVKKLEKLIKDNHDERRRVAREREKNKKAMQFACIHWRNKCSTQIIQSQFALGIETYDLDCDADRNVKSQSTRDYDALKKELSVFCISAKAYQSLRKRRGKDTSVAGFDNDEQTEVPKLRKHCMKLAKKLRLQGYRRFINHLFSLTFRLVSVLPRNDITLNVSKPYSTTEESRMKGEAKKLSSDIRNEINGCGRKIRDAICEKIFDRLDKVSVELADKAVSTVEHWVKADDKKTPGGYPYSVYKAFCRRNGDYKSLEHNWNEALAGPFVKKMTSEWEHVFGNRVPEALNSLRSIATRMLRVFHEAQVIQARSEYPTVVDMDPQIATYIARIEDAVTACQSSIDAKQKEISRLPVVEMKEAMIPTYKACSNRRGVDSFKWMKNIMRDDVDSQKDSVFKTITNSVDVGFQKMLETSLQELDKKLVHDILSRLDQDYLSVLKGGTSCDVNRPQQYSTDAILKILHDSDQAFEEILDNEAAVHHGGDGSDTVAGADSTEEVETDRTTAAATNEERKPSGHARDDTSDALSSVPPSERSDESE
ncbi:MAG: hypothetical protein Q9212_006460 [Teloschistes hypoglaucus]